MECNFERLHAALHSVLSFCLRTCRAEITHPCRTAWSQADPAVLARSFVDMRSIALLAGLLFALLAATAVGQTPFCLADVQDNSGRSLACVVVLSAASDALCTIFHNLLLNASYVEPSQGETACSGGSAAKGLHLLQLILTL